MSPLKVLVSGASGPIGAAILPSLAAAGHRVIRLVRRPRQSPDEVQWDPMRPIPDFSGYDAVIHLAGETIVGRWTQAKKKRILESRALGTRNLVEALAQAPHRPQVLITASAIGYYGDRGDKILNESSPSGQMFLSEVCRQWEAATDALAHSAVRVVPLRIGVMLSPTGGALKQMLPPFKLGLGGRIGSGRQYWSWVSIDDVAAAVMHVLQNDQVRGPVNVTAPTPVTNSEFTRVLARVLHRPAIFPMPAFAVRALFGQMGDELLLASARVVPARLQETGYRFRHSDLRTALQDLLGR